MKFTLMHLFSTTEYMHLRKLCYSSTDDTKLSVSGTQHYSSKQIYKIHIQILAIRKLLVLNISFLVVANVKIKIITNTYPLGI